MTLQANNATANSQMGARVKDAISALHARCSIYTAARTAGQLVQLTGWNRNANLDEARLLEPCCGDGALLLPAVRELIGWAKTNRVPFSHLAPRIESYEIDAAAAAKARLAVRKELESLGVERRSATALARRWVTTGDVMLSSDRQVVTHVVANPPYVRWSKIPSALSARYRRLGYGAADLSLIVLAKCIRKTLPGAQLAFLTTAQALDGTHGRHVRNQVLSACTVLHNVLVDRRAVFQERAQTAPAITVLRRLGGNREQPQPIRRIATSSAALQARYEQMQAAHEALGTRECEIGIGAALGCPPAYVVRKGEVERSLPLMRARDCGAPAADLHVLNPWDENGELVRLRDFPLMEAHLKRYKSLLTCRTCVTHSREWYRTIDKILAERVSRPKLGIPAICREARVYSDSVGRVFDNSLYWIRTSGWDLTALYNYLQGGVLELAIACRAPRLRGGYRRVNTRLLKELPLPAWSSLTNDQRTRLSRPVSAAQARAQVAPLFNFSTSAWDQIVETARKLQ